MQYCIDYYKGFQYMNHVDEITISYNRRDTSLLDFLILHKDKKINIYIEDAEDFLKNNNLDMFIQISKEYLDLDFRLKLKDPIKDDYSFQLYQKIRKETDIPYFFDTLISDWDTLQGYIKMSPISIYVVEDLCFELDKIADILHLCGIKVRTFANVCQTKWKDTPSLKTFFVRPEDVSIYENYIDVLEFFGNKKVLNTVYKVYTIDKKWFGELKELIIGFDSNLDSRFIDPIFAVKRISCNKKCLKGGKCRVCERVEDLSEVLKNNKMIIKVDKN